MALRRRRRNRFMEEKTWAGFSKTWPENAMLFLDLAAKKQGLFLAAAPHFRPRFLAPSALKTPPVEAVPPAPAGGGQTQGTRPKKSQKNRASASRAQGRFRRPWGFTNRPRAP
jgi:hypothetical protein